MPDISMCDNKSCKKFADCYRAQATPSKYRQAYTTFGEPDCDGCEDFKVIYTRTQKTLAEKDDLDLLCDAVNAFMNTKEETKHDKRN